MSDEHFDDWLSDADALLWTIEKDPVLRSTIVAVGLLDRAPDPQRVRESTARAARIIPRLRQTVVVPPMRVGPPRWVTSDDFDLDYHLHFERLVDGSHEDVLAVARRMAMDAFDRNRPLWEMVVLEGLPDDRAAVLVKLHHSLTDGVGGIEMAAHIFDTERRPRKPKPAPAPSAAPTTSRTDLARDALVEQLRQITGRVASAARTGASLLGEAMADPTAAMGAVAGGVQMAAKLLQPVSEPLSPLMRGRSLGRRLATVDVPLGLLKEAAHAAGGTVNDAYLAAVTGGLRRYHAKRGVAVEELRVTMPVNLRTDHDGAAGNRFTPARFALPVGIGDPSRRLRAIADLAHSWARDPALAITDDLAAVLNRLPTTVTTTVFGSLLKAVDFVATNVPGSTVPIYLGGAEVERLYPFAPPSGSSLAFGLLSHVDTCCVGITMDSAAVPDPELLVACTEQGFAEVLSLRDRP